MEHDFLTIEGCLKLTQTLTLLVDIRANEFRVLLSILDGRSPPVGYEKPLLSAIRLLLAGFEGKRRKNKSLAVLHSLRVGAIVARFQPEINVFDLLAALLHDKDEDLPPGEVDEERWRRMQQELNDIYDVIGEDERWFLNERLALLTREDGVVYFQYLRTVLAHADAMPNLVVIKLADKTDAVLDLVLGIPTASRYDFYKELFIASYVPARRAISLPTYDWEFNEDDAVLLLSSLGKALIFVSLLRKEGIDKRDAATGKLCGCLVDASIQQAQWVFLHHLSTKVPDGDQQRGIINRTREYCERPGALTSVTKREQGHLLDGTILDIFAVSDDKERKRRLAALYRDPTRFAEVILTMIALFSCFQENEDFYIQGIDIDGIEPVS